MIVMTLEEKLKIIIIEQYHSLKQFASEVGLPYTTVTGMLDRGINNAGMIKVARICKALNLDIDALADGKIEEKKIHDYQVSIEEYALLEKYRRIDDRGKDTLKYLLDDLYDRCNVQEEIQPQVVYKPWFASALSAGTGQTVLDEGSYEQIAVPVEFDDIDFVIGVAGDSMEPTFYHGDKVMIKKQQRINPGEVGAFIINGEAYIKELGRNCLISHNKEYGPIHFEESMRIDCIGKVVGKLEEVIA